MKTKLSLLLGVLALSSFTIEAKEYLGFDLGNESYEQVIDKLKNHKISYTIDYEIDEAKNEIKELPTLEINNYPSWDKYGKVDQGKLVFVEGKLATIHVSWKDKGDHLIDKLKDTTISLVNKKPNRSLFETLDAAFRKKYTTQSYPEKYKSLTEARYSDGDNVEIRLKRALLKPTNNPLEIFYSSSVTYWDNSLNQKSGKIINAQNKKLAEHKLNNDPDIQFAQDF